MKETFDEPPGYGPVCDLLWSDPKEHDKGEEFYFDTNYARGCGQVFGYDACKDFLDNNSLLAMVRAHEVRKDGYSEHLFRREEGGMPMCFTLFSAPNYWYSNFQFIKYSSIIFFIVALTRTGRPG